MHILIIPSWYPTYPGDIGGSFFREQSLALHKHGCKVGVIYPQLRSLRQWKSIWNGKYGIEEQIDEGMPTFRSHGMQWFPRIPRLGRVRWIKHGLDLFDKYTKVHGKPNAIHVHSILNAGILAQEIKKRHRIPFVITEHSSAYACGLVNSQDLKVAKEIMTAAERKLAVSNEFCKLLDKTLGGSNSWEYMPNIVNENFLDAEILEKNDDLFQFINVAITDKKKCQENILIAFGNKFCNQLKFKLIIGGDGPELQKLKNLATNLGISGQVEFTGRLSREQVRQKMSQSNAFVLSSRYETFGVVVIEALALGLPVIATCCGGPESIVQKEDGILVPVDDVESLANAMHEVFENASRYDQAAIRESCKRRFSEKAIAERLISIYQSISAEKNAD